jgi:hypothetical protein
MLGFLLLISPCPHTLWKTTEITGFKKKKSKDWGCSTCLACTGLWDSFPALPKIKKIKELT